MAKKHFPALRTEAIPGGARTSAALRMRSIGSLQGISNKHDTIEQLLQAEKQSHLERVGLVRTLSALKTATFELRYRFEPNLEQPTAGKISVYCVLHDTGGKPRLLAGMGALQRNLAGYFPHVVFEPVETEAELTTILQPEGKGYAQAIVRHRDNLSLVEAPETKVGFGRSRAEDMPKAKTAVQIPRIFPWKPSYDDWGTVCESLLRLSVPSNLIIRFRAALESQSNEVRRLRASVAAIDEMLLADGQRTEAERELVTFREELRGRETRLRESAFDLGVFVQSSVKLDPTVASMLGECITGALAAGEQGQAQKWEGGFDTRTLSAEKAIDPEFYPESEAYSASEVASAFRFPSPRRGREMNLPYRSFRTRLGASPLPEPGDLRFGINEHRNVSQPVGVPLEDRLRHTYIIGVTGSGKSTLMESMILQDIHAGRGVAFVDPHGESIDRILGKIPKERYDDVILIDPMDVERPVGFNLIACTDNLHRDRMIEELFAVIDRAYNLRDTGGPIFEQYFRGFLKLCMGDAEMVKSRPFVPTLLDFETAINDSEAREILARAMPKPDIAPFLRIIERAGGEASLSNLAPYITSKLNRFTQDTILKRMIGQSDIKIDFREAMDSGKIILFKLARGRFGAAVCDILTGAFVARLQMAAMSRADIPPEQRRPFMIYVDEFHVLVSEAFGEMLSEVRKYKVGLVLAHQFLSQLQVRTGQHSGADLVHAVLGNVGTTISFRVGREDADRLEPVLHPIFAADDLVNLPNYHAYMRTSRSASEIDIFNLATETDTHPYSETTAQTIRDLSRMKYGMPANEVDALNRARYEWLTNTVPGDGSKPRLEDITLEDLFK